MCIDLLTTLRLSYSEDLKEMSLTPIGAVAERMMELTVPKVKGIYIANPITRILPVYVRFREFVGHRLYRSTGVKIYGKVRCGACGAILKDFSHIEYAGGDEHTFYIDLGRDFVTRYIEHIKSAHYWSPKPVKIEVTVEIPAIPKKGQIVKDVDIVVYNPEYPISVSVPSRVELCQRFKASMSLVVARYLRRGVRLVHVLAFIKEGKVKYSLQKVDDVPAGSALVSTWSKEVEIDTHTLAKFGATGRLTVRYIPHVTVTWVDPPATLIPLAVAEAGIEVVKPSAQPTPPTKPPAKVVPWWIYPVAAVAAFGVGYLAYRAAKGR